MFMEAYKRAFAVLGKKPLTLWGLSLLTLVIGIFATVLTFPFLGLVGVGFTLVVTTGMSKVYIDALEEKEVNSDQLFARFKRVWTVLGGVAWQALWDFIWGFAVVAVSVLLMSIFALIGASVNAVAVFGVIGGIIGGIVAFAGSFFVLYKSYSYKFVPYILMTRPDVSATQALRLSVKLTKGKRLQMFVADLVFEIAVTVVFGLFAVLAMIPYVGWIFGIIALALGVIVFLFSGIFQGLYNAAFYLMPQQDSGAEGKFDAKLNQFTQSAQQGFRTQPQAQPYQAPAQPYQAPAQPQYQAPAQPQYQAPAQPQYQEAPYQPRIVYCTKCGAPYDANKGGCPNGH